MDFSKKFERQILAVAVLVGLVVAIIIPLSYFYVNRYEHEMIVCRNNEVLAMEVEQVIRINPAGWCDNVELLTKVASAFSVNHNVDIIRMYNKNGVLIYEQQFKSLSEFNFAVRTDVHNGGNAVGIVETVYGRYDLLSKTALLLCVCSIIGILLGSLVYRYPVSVVRKAQRKAGLVVSELTASNRRLETLSMTDGKTKLYNSTYLMERLQHEVEMARAGTSEFSVLMIDIDYFKKYNDRCGHIQGDKVLITLARLLFKNVRPHDVVGRFGGEEFMAILPGSSASNGVEVAKRLREAIEQHNFPDGDRQPNGRLTISVGVAAYEKGMSAEQVLLAADNALYAAKEGGRNRVCLDSAEEREIRGSKSSNRVVRISDIDFSITDVNELAAKVEMETATRVKSLQAATLMGFLRALQTGGHLSAEHSKRVNKIAMEMGRRLALSDKELLQLNWGTLLQDLGTMLVEEAIIKKPAPLTEAELEIVKQHPERGHDLLKGNAWLNEARKVVMYHHESWDGSGYPVGLKGAQIPYLARICAVASAAAAMSADRPYREALPREKVRGEIAKGSGQQFDWEMVRCYLEMDEEAHKQLVQSDNSSSDNEKKIST